MPMERVPEVDGFAAARYRTSITNAEGHVERLEHDARLGLPTRVTDANNRPTGLEYDALGRQVKQIREWDYNATTRTSYYGCTTTKRYYDKLGRLIRTEVAAFTGDNPRRVDAFYDARGRLACDSAPYHADETPHYTTYEYDLRDRVTVVTRPDDGATAIEYTADAAAHRVRIEVTETVKSADGTMSEMPEREESLRQPEDQDQRRSPGS